MGPASTCAVQEGKTPQKKTKKKKIDYERRNSAARKNRSPDIQGKDGLKGPAKGVLARFFRKKKITTKMRKEKKEKLGGSGPAQSS